MKKIKQLISGKASWVILLILVILFSFVSENFRTTRNFITILKQASVNAICGVGLAIILISGGIDLSTGSQAAFVGMVCSLLNTKAGWAFFPSMIVAILINTAIFGVLNGVAIAYTGMPPLIATLGTQNIARGAAYLINKGFIVYGLSKSATFIGQSMFLSIPVCVFLMMIVLLVGSFLLNKTIFGRLVFAVGANQEAARLSGISDKKMKVMAYVVGSLFIGLGGVVLMSRINSGMPSAGTDIYIEILAGCMIGGVSANGGHGKIFNMLGGILVMAVLTNGMNIAGLSEYWQYVAKGVILIATVGADAYKNMQVRDKKSHVIRTSQATN